MPDSCKVRKQIGAFVGFELLAAHDAVEHAMDDQIGIAADRRGEVGIAGRCQTEVADVFRLIDRLFHRAQEHAVDHPLFRFAAGGFQQPLNLQRREIFFILRQAVAQAQEKRLQRFAARLGPARHGRGRASESLLL